MSEGDQELRVLIVVLLAAAVLAAVVLLALLLFGASLFELLPKRGTVSTG